MTLSDNIKYGILTGWPNNKAQDVPLWADFLLKLPSAIDANEGKNLIIALVLPTLKFAAPLLATGNILHKIECGEYFADIRRQNRRLFDHLRLQQPGTKLVYTVDNVRYNAEIVRSNSSTISFRYQSKSQEWSEEQLCRVSTCDVLEIDTGDDYGTTIGNNNKNPSVREQFIKDVVGSLNSDNFEKTRYLCNVIGTQKKRISEEISSESFTTQNLSEDSTEQVGLEAIVRTRSQYQNTQLIASSYRADATPFDNSYAPLKIFNGAYAYTNLRSTLLDSPDNVVILLSREYIFGDGKGFDTAVHDVNEWRTSNGTPLEPSSIGVTIPEYIEYSIFTTDVHD